MYQMHLQTGSLAFAVAWITIEGGWVTVVTGRGQGRNYASCMARLAVMKRDLHVVAKFVAQKDAGAIFVQLRHIKPVRYATNAAITVMPMPAARYSLLPSCMCGLDSVCLGGGGECNALIAACILQTALDNSAAL